MGYDLRITRAIDWVANRGSEIPASEWDALVQADPDLVSDPSNGPHAVSFGSSGWFDWFEGNVFTTDPDSATMTKMLGIAEQMSAVIQGDDGESYDSARQWSRRQSDVRRRSDEESA
jgi:hypothetical protein